MKYLKKYNILLESLRIPKTKLNGIFYHGTVIRDKDLFYNFSFGYSDWDSIWFTDEEKVAEGFSDSAYRDEKTEIKIVYKVNIKEKNIADIDYQLFKKILSEEDLFDFREYIPTLTNKGYNGWQTLGSIDNIAYNDIAMFNLDNIKILGAKIFKNGVWSEYLQLVDIEEMLTN